MGGSSKKVTVGYKYYIGMHMILCHGPVDKITRIRVDGRDAWTGDYAAGRLIITKPSLFGGESREGGVEGLLDFETGGPGQVANDYLKRNLTNLVPAFRGVVGVVLRQMYIGMNPYLKKWAFRLQRIHVRQNGAAQWQNHLASVGTRVFGEKTRLYFALDVSGSMQGNRLATMKSAMSDVLDNILPFATGSADLDIRIVAYSASSTSITRYNCNHDDIEALRSWVNERTASGGTHFDEAIAPALTFFDPASPRNNLLFFITDGEPTGSSADVAVSLAADMLDLQNNPFSTTAGTAVYMHGINIELSDTSQTARLDNSTEGGVPVVSGEDSSGLTNAVLNGMMGAGNFSDMNPAHIIRECLTDPDWGMGYLESDVDEVSFYASAVSLKAEGFGLSFLWDRQIAIEDFVKEVLKHIDGVLYVDRKTGLFTLHLIRSNYDINDILHLDENNIDSISDYSRPAFGELTNSVTVNYWNLETGNDASVTIQDIALAQMQQATINTTLQYPGCTSPALASRLAQRDLKTLSAPRVSCTIYANRDAKNLSIGSVFKLSWQDYNIENMPMRVTGIAYGDGRNNKIRIQCTQDVFDMPSTAYVPPPESEWENPQQPPIPIVHQAVFEVPYLELVQMLGQPNADNILETTPGAGFVGATGARPSVASINARMYTDSGAGFIDAGLIDFCPVAILDADIGHMDEVLSFRGGQDLEQVRLGSWAQIGEELVAVVAIDSDTITVRRGVLDTAPKPHSEGLPILFWDDYSQGDETEYVESDLVDVRLTPVTGSGELPIEDATSFPVTIVGRAYKPYPPGNFKINNQHFPSSVTGPVSLSWASRNRVQQTGSTLIGFTDGSITPEEGVTYTVRAYNNTTEELKYEETGITELSHVIGVNSLLGLSTLRVEVWSVRSEFESYMPQSHVMEWSSGENLMTFEDGYTPNDGDNVILQFTE